MRNSSLTASCSNWWCFKFLTWENDNITVSVASWITNGFFPSSKTLEVLHSSDRKHHTKIHWVSYLEWRKTWNTSFSNLFKTTTDKDYLWTNQQWKLRILRNYAVASGILFSRKYTANCPSNLTPNVSKKTRWKPQLMLAG